MKLRAALCLVASLAVGCHSKPVASVEEAPAAPSTPDRLTSDEHLPEAETAFGLPLPKGMRLTRHFSDAAYFSGSLDMQSTLDHVRKYVEARDVEMTNQHVVFARARIKGNAERIFRIEISATPRGSQVHLKDITPPALARGLSEPEIWQRAGRKPDGSLLDPNQVY
jgi:hypothetical protein